MPVLPKGSGRVSSNRRENTLGDCGLQDTLLEDATQVRGTDEVWPVPHCAWRFLSLLKMNLPGFISRILSRVFLTYAPM